MEKKSFIVGFVIAIVLTAIGTAIGYNLKGNYDLNVDEDAYKRFEQSVMAEGKTIDDRINSDIKEKIDNSYKEEVRDAVRSYCERIQRSEDIALMKAAIADLNALLK